MWYQNQLMPQTHVKLNGLWKIPIIKTECRRADICCISVDVCFSVSCLSLNFRVWLFRPSRRCPSWRLKQILHVCNWRIDYMSVNKYMRSITLIIRYMRCFSSNVMHWYTLLKQLFSFVHLQFFFFWGVKSWKCRLFFWEKMWEVN